MANVFVPPPGLVEGTGAYAFMPASERQTLYNQLYGDWLATPVNGTYQDTEGLVPTVVTPSGQAEPFAGIPLSDEDRALLDTYSPGWKSTPAYYQTPTQLAALIAGAKREEKSQGYATGKGVSSGVRIVMLNETTRLHYDEAANMWTISDRTSGPETWLNGRNVTQYGWGPGREITGAQAQALLNLAGASVMASAGTPGLYQDRALLRFHQSGDPNKQSHAGLSAQEIETALSAGTPAPVAETPATTVQNIPAPHLVAALANPPTKPGESTPAALASVAAKDTVDELVAELQKKQGAEENPTVLVSPTMPGYTPIRLRPRT